MGVILQDDGNDQETLDATLLDALGPLSPHHLNGVRDGVGTEGSASGIRNEKRLLDLMR